MVKILSKAKFWWALSVVTFLFIFSIGSGIVNGLTGLWFYQLPALVQTLYNISPVILVLTVIIAIATTVAAKHTRKAPKNHEHGRKKGNSIFIPMLFWVLFAASLGLRFYLLHNVMPVNPYHWSVGGFYSFNLIVTFLLMLIALITTFAGIHSIVQTKKAKSLYQAGLAAMANKEWEKQLLFFARQVV